jgi:ssDNA-binding replication factor A large subunit
LKPVHPVFRVEKQKQLDQHQHARVHHKSSHQPAPEQAEEKRFPETSQEVIPQGRGTNEVDRGYNFSRHERCEYGKQKRMVHKEIL